MEARPYQTAAGQIAGVAHLSCSHLPQSEQPSRMYQGDTCLTSWLHIQDLKFITPAGQAVYNAMFKPFKAPANEMFLPMRTAFVYDMEETDSNTDVPTTLRRSKEDCPPVSQLMDSSSVFSSRNCSCAVT